jgi:hypothetical protein
MATVRSVVDISDKFNVDNIGDQVMQLQVVKNRNRVGSHPMTSYVREQDFNNRELNCILLLNDELTLPKYDTNNTRSVAPCSRKVGFVSAAPTPCFFMLNS